MICRTCHLPKPLSAYYVDAKGYRKGPDCKLCISAKKRGTNNANSKARTLPERGREWFQVVVE